VAAGVLAMALSRKRPEISRIALIGVLAYGIAAPWIKPSTVAAVQRNAQLLGNYAMGRSQYIYLALWLTAVVLTGLLLRRTRLSEAVRFAILFLLLMATPPLGYLWFHNYPIPQPDRYHLEMEMPIAMLVGLLLGWNRKWLIVPVAAALALLAWFQVPYFRSYAGIHVRPFDITKTVEYESARWLDANMPGRRVFATGSTQFWLNAFSDNPQLGGGFEQGRTNRQLPAVDFAIRGTKNEVERSILLLKAYGVRAIIVGGEKSRDAYPGYRDPNKFAGHLPERWRDGDDVIYEVPARNDSLAHVIRAEDLMDSREIDWDALGRYVRALDGAAYSQAEFHWVAPGHARIKAPLRAGELVSVQVSWDPGWSAHVNGRDCEIRGDGLGQLVIDPRATGMGEIDLTFTGGWQTGIARALMISVLAMMAILFRKAKQ
jgi:hypothetical protein